MAAVLIQCGRHRGVRSTGVLFIYWLLQFVSAILALQSHARAVAAGVTVFFQFSAVNNCPEFL